MTWSRARALARIRKIGLIPIVRTAAATDALAAVEAILEAGVGIIEITMNVPDATAIIARVVKRHANTLVGAGTVLDPDSCRAALDAGAAFIVTPALEIRVVETARRAGAPCIPGALTPTEVLRASEAGADLVKIFPCGSVGGPRYIQALRGPFSHIDFVPTGGVTLETIPAFFAAGVAAVGVGSELLDPHALRARQLDVITASTRRFLHAVRGARRACA